jgi:hypothetical protein
MSHIFVPVVDAEGNPLMFAQGTMVGVVVRPSMSQALRLNED